MDVTSLIKSEYDGDPSESTNESTSSKVGSTWHLFDFLSWTTQDISADLLPTNITSTEFESSHSATATVSVRKDALGNTLENNKLLSKEDSSTEIVSALARTRRESIFSSLGSAYSLELSSSLAGTERWQTNDELATTNHTLTYTFKDQTFEMGNLSVLLNHSQGNDTETWRGWESLSFGQVSMILVAIALLLVAVLTVLGNLLVGISLFKYNSLRTVSNMLIGNLALSDLLLGLTIIPLSALKEALGHWVFGEYICYAWLCTDVLYCTASIWNLCIIGLDRYTATLYPVWYRDKRSPKQAALYALIVWGVSFAISLPPILGWNDIKTTYVYDSETKTYQCQLFDKATYVVYSACGSFFIPLTITGFFYARIVMVLRRRMAKLHKRSKPRPSMVQAPDSTPLVKSQIRNDNSNTRTATKTTYVEIEMTPATASKSHHSGASYPTDEATSESGSPPSEDDSSAAHKSDHPLVAHKKGASLKPNHSNIKVNPLRRETEPMVEVIVSADVCNGKTQVKTENSSKKTAKKKTGCWGNQKRRNVIKSPQPSKKTGHQGHKKQDREVKATIRMAIIIAFFCGSWIGFFTTYLLRGVIKGFYIPTALDSFFFWLGYLNSFINPILYTKFNEDFRKAFKNILGCGDKGRRNHFSASHVRH